MPTINANQFEQKLVKGALDLQVMRSGVISAVVSASQATALVPGQKVKLDSTTNGAMPTVVAAAYNEAGIGIVAFDEKKSSPVAGDVIQVALLISGPVMWMTAGASIAAQAQLEFITGATTVQTQSAGKYIGVAIDPATTGQLLRVILRDSAQA